MCVGIALAWSELPTELIDQHGLQRRLHDRGGEREVQFLYRDRHPRLPVWRDGQLQIVRWGNRRGESRFLPRTGWSWLSTIESGYWRNVETTAVDIPATLGLERGVWFRIRQGIRGLLVEDERGDAVVYMICEPASHYYKVITPRAHCSSSHIWSSRERPGHSTGHGAAELGRLVPSAPVTVPRSRVMANRPDDLAPPRRDTARFE